MDVILEFLKRDARNPSFQLFLSSKPTRSLTINVLQQTYKVVLEPQKGVKANLQKLITNLLPQYKSTEERDVLAEFGLYRKLVFGLCWLHSLLNERKRFRSLGWSVPYEFSDTDFVYSERILQEFVANASRQPEDGFQWDSFAYVLTQIIYGGRITDQWDMKLLETQVKELFNEATITAKGGSFCSYDNCPFRLLPELEDSFGGLKGKNLNT